MLTKGRTTLCKELRKLRGTLSLRDAEEVVGHAFTSLAKIEKGERMPGWDILEDIVKKYSKGKEEMGRWAAMHYAAKNAEKYKMAVKFEKSK